MNKIKLKLSHNWFMVSKTHFFYFNPSKQNWSYEFRDTTYRIKILDRKTIVLATKMVNANYEFARHINKK